MEKLSRLMRRINPQLCENNLSSTSSLPDEQTLFNPRSIQRRSCVYLVGHICDVHVALHLTCDTREPFLRIPGLYYNALSIELRDMFRMIDGMRCNNENTGEEDGNDDDEMGIFYNWFDGFLGIVEAMMQGLEKVMFEWMEDIGSKRLDDNVKLIRRKVRCKRIHDQGWDIIDLKQQYNSGKRRFRLRPPPQPPRPQEQQEQQQQQQQLNGRKNSQCSSTITVMNSDSSTFSTSSLCSLSSKNCITTRTIKEKEKEKNRKELNEWLDDVYAECLILTMEILSLFQTLRIHMPLIMDSSLTMDERVTFEMSLINELRASREGTFALCAMYHALGFGRQGQERERFTNKSLSVKMKNEIKNEQDEKEGKERAERQMKRFEMKHKQLADKLATTETKIENEFDQCLINVRMFQQDASVGSESSADDGYDY